MLLKIYEQTLRSEISEARIKQGKGEISTFKRGQ
jgi:hypothetical protein